MSRHTQNEKLANVKRLESRCKHQSHHHHHHHAPSLFRKLQTSQLITNEIPPCQSWSPVSWQPSLDTCDDENEDNATNEDIVTETNPIQDDPGPGPKECAQYAHHSKRRNIQNATTIAATLKDKDCGSNWNSNLRLYHVPSTPQESRTRVKRNRNTQNNDSQTTINVTLKDFGTSNTNSRLNLFHFSSKGQQSGIGINRNRTNINIITTLKDRGTSNSNSRSKLIDAPAKTHDCGCGCSGINRNGNTQTESCSDSSTLLDNLICQCQEERERVHNSAISKKEYGAEAASQSLFPQSPGQMQIKVQKPVSRLKLLLPPTEIPVVSAAASTTYTYLPNINPISNPVSNPNGLNDCCNAQNLLLTAQQLLLDAAQSIVKSTKEVEDNGNSKRSSSSSNNKSNSSNRKKNSATSFNGSDNDSGNGNATNSKVGIGVGCNTTTNAGTSCTYQGLGRRTIPISRLQPLKPSVPKTIKPTPGQPTPSVCSWLNPCLLQVIQDSYLQSLQQKYPDPNGNCNCSDDIGNPGLICFTTPQEQQQCCRSRKNWNSSSGRCDSCSRGKRRPRRSCCKHQERTCDCQKYKLDPFPQLDSCRLEYTDPVSCKFGIRKKSVSNLNRYGSTYCCPENNCNLQSNAPIFVVANNNSKSKQIAPCYGLQNNISNNNTCLQSKDPIFVIRKNNCNCSSQYLPTPMPVNPLNPSTPMCELTNPRKLLNTIVSHLDDTDITNLLQEAISGNSCLPVPVTPVPVVCKMSKCTCTSTNNNNKSSPPPPPRPIPVELKDETPKPKPNPSKENLKPVRANNVEQPSPVLSLPPETTKTPIQVIPSESSVSVDPNSEMQTNLGHGSNSMQFTQSDTDQDLNKIGIPKSRMLSGVRGPFPSGSEQQYDETNTYESHEPQPESALNPEPEPEMVSITRSNDQVQWQQSEHNLSKPFTVSKIINPISIKRIPIPDPDPQSATELKNDEQNEPSEEIPRCSNYQFYYTCKAHLDSCETNRGNEQRYPIGNRSCGCRRTNYYHQPSPSYQNPHCSIQAQVPVIVSPENLSRGFQRTFCRNNMFKEHVCYTRQGQGRGQMNNNIRLNSVCYRCNQHPCKCTQNSQKYIYEKVRNTYAGNRSRIDDD